MSKSSLGKVSRKRRRVISFRSTDIDRKSQVPIDVKLGPPPRARSKKLKIHEANKANGMLEEFEDLGKTSKLFSIGSISKDHSREQIGDPHRFSMKVLKLQNPQYRSFVKRGDLGRYGIQSTIKRGSTSKWYQRNLQMEIIFLEILTPQVLETLPL
ncbi:hypothetical protein M9H77_30997 [Catharanthus roseus]|uniref:Uncharacterized protein n=1 Tax=Catharanthus roseus TaxID=4058 RepID=A0ACC0A0P2_CATRO|nr:hypothetical protein M9H77_30997 [Catharanthus roseus]